MVKEMAYKNRYRHLLRKDVAFAIQDKYRFVGLDELISASVFYPFSFESKYRLVEIDELLGSVKMQYSAPCGGACGCQDKRSKKTAVCAKIS